MEPGSGSECLSSAQKKLYLLFQMQQHVSQKAVCTYLQMHCRRRTRGCFRLWYSKTDRSNWITVGNRERLFFLFGKWIWNWSVLEHSGGVLVGNWIWNWSKTFWWCSSRKLNLKLECSSRKLNLKFEIGAFFSEIEFEIWNWSVLEYSGGVLLGNLNLKLEVTKYVLSPQFS